MDCDVTDPKTVMLRIHQSVCYGSMLPDPTARRQLETAVTARLASAQTHSASKELKESGNLTGIDTAQGSRTRRKSAKEGTISLEGGGGTPCH